ncbi:MAG: GntR family transcriptional regulator [Acidobacteria bacterium]|nr:GntR family transcriptional regulator [Acidobacteriota bacterium]
MQTALDKRLPIPLYHQLKSVILNAIQSGDLKPDDQIPPESELAQTYGVSKITVRQALRELADLGYVRREQGRGTFVARTRLAQGPRDLTSFTEEMRRHGLAAASRVLEAGVMPADAALAERLGLRPGDDVFVLKRLRLADGEPMSIQTAHIPLELAPGLPEESLDDASLYEILQLHYGRQPSRAREAHSAVLIEAEDAELLGVPPGSPALAAERIAYLESGQPLEFVHSVVRGDRYKIVLDLVKEPA